MIIQIYLCSKTQPCQMYKTFAQMLFIQALYVCIVMCYNRSLNIIAFMHCIILNPVNLLVLYRWYQEFIISRKGECLTAYTCFKHTASSTESTPPGVNQVSAPICKALLYFIKRNCALDIIDINVSAYCRWAIEL